MAFSSDGKNVVSFDQSKNLRIWDVATGQELHTFEEKHSWTRYAAFSPDGKTLISGDSDNPRTLQLLDVASGQKLHTFKTDTDADYIHKVSFSSDGKAIVSGSKLTLWDATERTGWSNLWGLINGSGQVISTSKDYSYRAEAVAFSPDGRIISSHGYGVIRLWNPQTGQEIAQMVSFKDGEWVTLTPEGYYTASTNGEKYLNVRIDDQVYGIDNFKTRFHRPDIVKLALELGDTQKAIAQLNAPSPAPVAAVTASPQVAAPNTAKVEPSPPPIQTGTRLALVIGNTNYPSQRLINPANDAEDMGQALKQLGFTVRRYNDLDLQKLSQAISTFMDELRQSPKAVALFYYAGHGAEIAGAGYLLPIAHGITQEVDVPYRAYSVAQVMDNLKAAHHGVNIVIVDACRNNPFGSNSPVDGRSRGGGVSRGLQRVNQCPWAA